jgi:hypothetical protein
VVSKCRESSRLSSRLYREPLAALQYRDSLENMEVYGSIALGFPKNTDFQLFFCNFSWFFVENSVFFGRKPRRLSCKLPYFPEAHDEVEARTFPTFSYPRLSTLTLAKHARVNRLIFFTHVFLVFYVSPPIICNLTHLESMQRICTFQRGFR